MNIRTMVMDRLQTAIMSGAKPDSIKPGTMFKYHGTDAEVTDIKGDDITVKFQWADHPNEVQADYSGQDVHDTSNDFHELDVYDNGNPQTSEKPSGGYPPFTEPKSGPLDKFGLPGDVDSHQGEVAGDGEKVFVWPEGELRSPHPPFRHSPAPNEPSPDVVYSRNIFAILDNLPKEAQ